MTFEKVPALICIITVFFDLVHDEESCRSKLRADFYTAKEWHLSFSVFIRCFCDMGRKLKRMKKTAQSFNIMIKIAVFLCLPVSISSPSGSVCK